MERSVFGGAGADECGDHRGAVACLGSRAGAALLSDDGRVGTDGPGGGTGERRLAAGGRDAAGIAPSVREKAMEYAGVKMGSGRAMGISCGCSGDCIMVFAERTEREMAARGFACDRADLGRVVPCVGSLMRKMAKREKGRRTFWGKGGIKGEDIGVKKSLKKNEKKVKKGVDKRERAWYSIKVASDGSC